MNFQENIEVKAREPVFGERNNRYGESKPQNTNRV
jgi:hypothetical protein